MKAFRSGLGCCLALVAAIANSHAEAASRVWQFSVPVGHDPLRRAYLWIPEHCLHVRGVLIGIQNMLEQEIFEDPAIRWACADENLAIVWIAPADDLGDRASPFHRFNPPAAVVWDVEQILSELARESGYSEIENTPLLPVAHSAATPFGWGLASALGSSRVLAFLPYKGWFLGLAPGVPTLHVSAEYAEVGGTNWGDSYLSDRAAVEKIRAGGADELIGEFADIGAGHYEWNPNAAPVVAMFIRKAAQYRLPQQTASASLNGTKRKVSQDTVELKPIDPRAGWLVAPNTLGTRNFHPVPAKDFAGDPRKMLWYFDREMAETVNDYMVAGLSKKPQVIDFLDDQGRPEPLVNGGNPTVPTKLLPDGFTFQVAATFLNQSPTPRLYGGAKVGHADGPILFKASSGAIKQTGSNTFRIWMRRGGLIQQGPPWEPWIIAYQPGDGEYRRCDRPGHPWLATQNNAGRLQAIDFPKIENQKLGVKTLRLHAISDASLPVQFYVVSGPVELAADDRTLEFLPVPPRSRFPVKVIIGAYQWGRLTEPKVQTAGPVFREFYIEKP